VQALLTSTWIKIPAFLLCLCPFVALAWKALNGGLGANPIEFITHKTGDWTLIFLVLTLTVTPARRVLGLSELIRFRRMLGLFAFFYGFLHFSTWIGLDKFFDLAEMLHDVRKRPFHNRRLHRVRADDSARGYLHGRMDSTLGRQALAEAASPGLHECHRRRRALLLAGKVGCPEAAVLRGYVGPALSLPLVRMACAQAGATTDQRA
jgi:hypothetical protein